MYWNGDSAGNIDCYQGPWQLKWIASQREPVQKTILNHQENILRFFYVITFFSSNRKSNGSSASPTSATSLICRTLSRRVHTLPWSTFLAFSCRPTMFSATGVIMSARFKLAWCLIMEFGLTAIPPSEFYLPKNQSIAENYLHFAICENDEVLEDAKDRLRRLKPYLRVWRLSRTSWALFAST